MDGAGSAEPAPSARPEPPGRATRRMGGRCRRTGDTPLSDNMTVHGGG
ncbi:hypothetical protein F750_0515 [Streptomyces sp. PAMC 26508]|nr:hypothetical protein F750_0515 [Streptomyces sp. PAMC 26508]